MNVAKVAQSIADDCIGFRIRILNRIVSRIYDDALRPYGIRFSQMNILTVLVLKGPIQPTAVGNLLSLEKSTLSRNVRLMEENGWIKTSPTDNGVGHLLEITRQGRLIYKKVAPSWRLAQQQLESAIGSQGISAIRAAADELRAADSNH